MKACWSGSDDTSARLAALEQYDILDTPPEPGFDDIAHLASQLCRTPVALVSLVAADRQWFKARVGFTASEAPLAQSACAHAVPQPGLLVVPDLSRDPRTRDHPAVTGGPRLRFCAGARLETADAAGIGVLCVLDTKPRPEGLTNAEAEGLGLLARQVMGPLELRRAIAKRDEAVRSLALAERRLIEDRERLGQTFAQAPGFMAMLREPTHHVEMANVAYLRRPPSAGQAHPGGFPRP